MAWGGGVWTIPRDDLHLPSLPPPLDNYNDTLIVSHLRLIKPFAIC